jgi:hypothetical protein
VPLWCAPCTRRKASDDDAMKRLRARVAELDVHAWADRFLAYLGSDDSRAHLVAS